MSIEKSETSCIVFCDISKAFDRIWHKGLISKLKSYGIKGKLLLWLEDYLRDRKQQVLLQNSESHIGMLKSGVPQGSVLGPLLFLLYINDIADEIKSLVRLFADDSSLISSAKNINDIQTNLNNDLKCLENWSSKKNYG